MKNNSRSRLLCASTSTDIKDGQWHNIEIDPPSVIEPGSTYSFDLNDKGGTSRGAEGSATFSARAEGKTIDITFYMSCPLIGDNKAAYSISDKNSPFVISAKVPSQSGHPIEGHFEVQQF